MKADYPKVPIIENEDTFNKYVNAGSELRKLHLMKTNIEKNLQIKSSNNNLVIDMVKYEDGKIRINKDTLIVGITEEVWKYCLCGYQVIDKWFKSHKGDNFDIDYFNHIKKVVGIIEETIKIQQQL